MILCIAGVLAQEELEILWASLDSTEFRDGRETAGWHAKLVKHNEQAFSSTAVIAAKTVEIALRENELFRMAALPRRFRPILFSRYATGMSYDRHIDDAIMGGDDPVRSDISVTLFLSEPDSYDGGELVIENTSGEESYKLPAGSVLLYPSNSLHRVEPVRAGERRVAVTWIQSLVRDPSQREILFDIDSARRHLFEREGKSPAFDLVSKSYGNLLRRWGTP